MNWGVHIHTIDELTELNIVIARDIFIDFLDKFVDKLVSELKNLLNLALNIAKILLIN